MEKRRVDTEAFLEQTENIVPGLSLPDHQFTDFHGNRVNLYQRLQNKTVVAFISERCPTCRQLMRNIAGSIEDAADLRGVVFISEDDSRGLRDLCSETGLEGQMLFDEPDGHTDQLLDVPVYPIITVVDRLGIIQEVFLIGLTDEELSNIIEFNRSK